MRATFIVSVLVAALVLFADPSHGWGWLHNSLFDGDAAVIDLSSAAVQLLHADANRCPWLVLFYDSMCGHCRAAAPIYAQAAHDELHAISGASTPILFGAVNCADHEEACSAANVTFVPNLFVGLPSEELRTTPRLIELRRSDKTSPDPTLVWKPELPLEDVPQFVADATKTVPLTPGEASACRAISQYARFEKQRTLDSGKEKLPTQGQGQTRISSFGKAVDTASRGQENTSFVVETRLHQADVAGAFFITMWHEVSMAAPSPRVFDALMNFLDHVSRALPQLRASELRRHLLRDSRLLDSRAQWRSVVESVGVPFEGDLSGVRWYMCRGSSWKERGLPCGLWAMYHALLVNAAPGESLRSLMAIRGYIEHFFACFECRQHFISMDFHLNESSSDEDAVLWLWDAHNQVNLRLASEKGSSDPLVPKILWPSRVLCPRCRGPKGTWNNVEVANFLSAHYTWDRMVHVGGRLDTMHVKGSMQPPHRASVSLSGFTRMFLVSLGIAIVPFMLWIALRALVRRDRSRAVSMWRKVHYV